MPSACTPIRLISLPNSQRASYSRNPVGFTIGADSKAWLFGARKGCGLGNMRVASGSAKTLRSSAEVPIRTTSSRRTPGPITTDGYDFARSAAICSRLPHHRRRWVPAFAGTTRLLLQHESAARVLETLQLGQKRQAEQVFRQRLVGQHHGIDVAHHEAAELDHRKAGARGLDGAVGGGHHRIVVAALWPQPEAGRGFLV